MEISQALQNAQSIDRVVEIINGGGTSSYSANEIAGQYAWQAADQAGYGIDRDNIDGHLGFLIDAGAEFDHAMAIEYALKQN